MRRGLGACVQSTLQGTGGSIGISDPNYYSANAQNFANWLNWLQCEQPGTLPPVLTPQQQALAAQFGVDTSNLSGSGRAGADVAAAAPVIAAATRGGGAVQPVWGGVPRMIPISLPSPGPTQIPGSAPAAPAPGFLSSIPWWGWGIAAVGAYYLFAGGGHGR